MGYPPRVIYSLLFYLLLITLIMTAKPSVVFAPDGAIKPFGVARDMTMCPLGVVTVLCAILSSYVFTLIDVVYG